MGLPRYRRPTIVASATWRARFCPRHETVMVSSCLPSDVSSIDWSGTHAAPNPSFGTITGGVKFRTVPNRLRILVDRPLQPLIRLR